MVNRLVKVEAVIERPPPPPWVGDLPVEEATSWWPGTLLDWRWVDKPEGTWTALVQYRREGLTYLHWVSGELLDVEPDVEVNKEPRRSGPMPLRTGARTTT